MYKLIYFSDKTQQLREVFIGDKEMAERLARKYNGSVVKV